MSVEHICSVAARSLHVLQSQADSSGKTVKILVKDQSFASYFFSTLLRNQTAADFLRHEVIESVLGQCLINTGGMRELRYMQQKLFSRISL